MALPPEDWIMEQIRNRRPGDDGLLERLCLHVEQDTVALRSAAPAERERIARAISDTATPADQEMVFALADRIRTIQP